MSYNVENPRRIKLRKVYGANVTNLWLSHRECVTFGKSV